MAEWIYQLRDGEGKVHYEGTHEDCLKRIAYLKVGTIEDLKIHMTVKGE